MTVANHRRRTRFLAVRAITLQLIAALLAVSAPECFARTAIPYRLYPGFGCGCGPDAYSGNVMHSFADPIPTAGYPLVNNIHLNSQYVETRLLGNATFTYDIHIVNQTNGYSTAHLTVVDGTGRIWDLSEPGLFSTLSPNGTGWILSHAGPPESVGRAGNFTYYFDSGGRLSSLVDPMGNVQNLTYPSGGVTITDVGTGKQIVLSPVSGGISVTEAGIHTATIFKAGNLVTSIVWYGATGAALTSVDFTYDTTQTATYGMALLKTIRRDSDDSTRITYSATPVTSPNSAYKVPFLNVSGPLGELATYYQPGLAPLAGAPSSAVTRVSNHNNKSTIGTTDYEFDNQGNLVRVLTPMPFGATVRPITEISWDSTTNLPTAVTFKDTSTTPPTTHTYSCSYTPSGMLNMMNDPRGGAWTFNWQPNGVDLFNAYDPLGLLFTVNYDYNGVYNPQLNPSSYNLPHFPTRISDAGNFTTTLSGNAKGQIAVLTPPSPGAGGFSANYYGLPYSGLVQDEFLGGRQVHVDDYDVFGDAVTWTKYPYSPNGGSQSQTYTASFDTLQRPLQLNQPDSTHFQWNYNGRNLDYTLDEAVKRMNYTFCPVCGALEGLSIGSRTSPAWSVSWADDNDGDVTDFVNPLGKHTQYTYGSARELKTVTYPIGGGALNFTYDNFGKVKTFQNARGNTFSFTRDAADNLTSVSQNGVAGSLLSFTYNSDNSLATAANSMGTITIVPDPVTRSPGSVAYDYRAGGLPDIQKVQYQYNPDGTRQFMTWWNGATKVGTWSYHYNAARQVVSVSSIFSDVSEATAWLYEGDGKLDWQHGGNGTWNGLFYGGSGTVKNDRDWPTVVGNWSPAYGTYFQVDRLTYDNQAAGGTVGLLTGVLYIDKVSSAQYSYNGLRQLASESASGPTGYSSRNYEVDSAGNRKRFYGTNFNYTYGYNDADFLTTVNGSPTGVVNDADGNLCSLPGSGGLVPHNLSWNALGQATVIDGTSYGYDALGHRAKQQLYTGATTFYVFDGDVLLGEVQPGGGAFSSAPNLNAPIVGDDPDVDYTIPPDDPTMPSVPSDPVPVPDPDPGFGTPPDTTQPGSFGSNAAVVVGGAGSSTATVAYTWGPAGPVSERINPGQPGATSYWYHFGPLGETRCLTDVNGVKRLPYAYTAFGVPVLAGPSTSNPFRFGGQAGYYTTPSGLVLCGARWYDPNLGRWLSRDPIGYNSGPNLFEYCGGDPVGALDPFGLDFLGIPTGSWIGFGAGALTFAVSLNPVAALGVGTAAGALYSHYHDGNGFVTSIAEGGQGALAAVTLGEGALALRSYMAYRAFAAGGTGAAAVLASHSAESPVATETIGCNGRQYSVAYSTVLSRLQGSRAQHFRLANVALKSAMNEDSEFAGRMENLIPGITDFLGPQGRAAPSTSPAALGWTWHHANEPGNMQLVPSDDHWDFFNLFHPGGKGGYSIWGK